MKIYPSRHKIIQTNKVNTDVDIPLAYIDTHYTDYDIKLIPETGFESYYKTEVVPYKEYDTDEICLFDSQGNIVDKTPILQRNGNKYIYIPQDAISFVPQNFSYSVIGKKAMAYSTDRPFNLSVACVDSDSQNGFPFAKSLIQIFGDAPKRGLCPPNISVNDMDLSVQSLINSTIKAMDFVFVESTDGVKYKGSDVVIDIDSYLNENTNVWISTDVFTAPMLVTKEEANYTLLEPNVINAVPYKTKYSFQPTITEDPKMHRVFNNDTQPVAVLEHKDKGFVIVSHSSFMADMEKSKDLLYEIMMYVYMNSYLGTDNISSWITDSMPDYIVSNGALTTKDQFTSNMELWKMFGLRQNDIMFSKITIDTSNVKCTGIVNDFIIFEKDSTGDNKKYADPEKPVGAISVYTPRKDVIYFNRFVYEINDSMNKSIFVNKQENTINVIFQLFRNSLHNVNMKDIPTIKKQLVGINTAVMYICCKGYPNNVSIVLKDDYKSDDGTVIAKININRTAQYSKVFDMRQPGGGLPDGAEPNYDMLDIGNMLGRPYRKAGTVIITLPKRLEPYEDMLLKAIQKHTVGEEFPIIIFE
jgi:hypothetical protein